MGFVTIANDFRYAEDIGADDRQVKSHGKEHHHRKRLDETGTNKDIAEQIEIVNILGFIEQPYVVHLQFTETCSQGIQVWAWHGANHHKNRVRGDCVSVLAAQFVHGLEKHMLTFSLTGGARQDDDDRILFDAVLGAQTCFRVCGTECLYTIDRNTARNSEKVVA